MAIPKAKQVPHKIKLHGHERIDNYYWLNDRDKKEVVTYIEQENQYTDAQLEPTKGLQEELYKEMKGRIKEDEASAPYLSNGYWYYTRFEEGKGHPIYCRKKGALTAEEEILIDENIAAAEHPYYEVASYSISEDNKILAFAEDIEGRRLHQIKFKNLETGELLPYLIEHAEGDLAWHNDNATLYYSVKEQETLRPYLVQAFNIVTGVTTSIYEEIDDTFITTINKSSEDSTLFIGCHSSLSTEYHFKSANDESAFELFLPRHEKHEYYLDCDGATYFIKSNWEAKNFIFATCNVHSRQPQDWQVIQQHNPEVLIEDFEVFKKKLVVQEKTNGLTRLKVIERSDYTARIIPPNEETYTLYFENNPELNSNTLRIGYCSMTTPNSIIDIDLDSFEQTAVKQSAVLGHFDANEYASERIWATATDGTQIPASLVYKKALFKKDGTNPTLLYGYGAYGATIDPYFSTTRLSLLNRGYIFVITHVRGSEYLGTHWYDDGKLFNKMNTFTDFITIADHLIATNYSNPKNMFAMGGSAGGLLITAVANMRPNLWKGLIAEVPFVDVVTTMMDETIPLTTGEYDEWGDPAEKAYYEYMLSYSPYDQLKEQHYPNMLITSGLHDSQVQYWEPTKYVAKLRSLKTDDNLLLLRTEMDAGHGGTNDRYEQLREMAEQYAFFILLADEKL